MAWDGLGKNLGPYRGFVIVDDGIRKQARVHHLDQVFVLEIFVDRFNPDRLQALGHEGFAQFSEMTDVNAGITHMDIAPREIFDLVELGRGGTGDDNLLVVLQPRIDEIDDGRTLGSDCQIGGDGVAIAFVQSLQQPLAGGGKQVDVEPKRLEFVPRIDRRLERTSELSNHAHLTAAIDKKEGLAVGDEKTKRPPLQRRGKIAFPSARFREHEPLAGHALPQRGQDRSNGECSKAQEKKGNPSAHRPDSDQRYFS